MAVASALLAAMVPAVQASITSPATPGGSEAVLSIVNNTTNDTISIDLGKTMSELEVGDSFALDSAAQSFISSAGGLGGVSWAVIAGDGSNITTSVFLTTSTQDLSAVQVANATKGTWGNSVLQLINNLNSGDATGEEINNLYGPYTELTGSPNYIAGGHFDWQTGSSDLDTLALGTESQNFFMYTLSGFVGTATGAPVLASVSLSTTQLSIDGGGGGPVLAPPPVPEDEIVAIPDMIGSATAEYVLYSGETQNQFDVIDGSTGAVLRTLSYFSSAWEPQDFASLADGNGDGMPDDPALAVMALNTNTGQIRVQLRFVDNGNQIGTNVTAFNSDWNPLAVAILEDSDGNGIATDPAAAVLAQNTIDGRISVDLIRFSDGSQLGRWNFFRPTWEAKSVAAFVPTGGVPRVAVLATDPSSGKTKVQYRLTTNGNKAGVFVFGSGIEGFDFGVVLDSDGNGTADDPAYAVIGKKQTGSQNNIVRLRRESDGANLAEWRVISGSFDVKGMSVLPDANMSGYEDIAAFAKPTGGGSNLIQIRDLETGANIDTVTLVP